MAFAVRSLRAGLRSCGRQPSATRSIAPTRTAIYARRALSSTPTRRADDKDKNKTPSEAQLATKAAPKAASGKPGADNAELRKALDVHVVPNEVHELMLKQKPLKSNPSKSQRQAQAQLLEAYDGQSNFSEDQKAIFDELASTMKDMEDAVMKATRVPKKTKRESFWGEDEEDPDVLVDDLDEDDPADDDILAMGHGKLEEFREQREYARIAAWQMPLLSKLARKFEPPTPEQCLRFRYTTYMGEEHPAASKVVVEFSPRDLPLNEAEQLKLKKLLGARWNPETNVAKMSCEQFDHQAQNKRYLGDLVEKLVAQAKDKTDTFEDVPLDTRHHQIKVRPQFPKEWRLTEERMQQLDAARQKSLLLDQEKEQSGLLVDGNERVDKFFAEPAMANLRIPERLNLKNPRAS
ncbi:mitochondrial ribosomal subunit protein-domain-containing protein, partial [Apiospora kogelbergensis]